MSRKARGAERKPTLRKPKEKVTRIGSARIKRKPGLDVKSAGLFLFTTDIRPTAGFGC
jgi:hypothetical protein